MTDTTSNTAEVFEVRISSRECPQDSTLMRVCETYAEAEAIARDYYVTRKMPVFVRIVPR